MYETFVKCLFTFPIWFSATCETGLATLLRKGRSLCPRFELLTVPIWFVNNFFLDSKKKNNNKNNLKICTCEGEGFCCLPANLFYESFKKRICNMPLQSLDGSWILDGCYYCINTYVHLFIYFCLNYTRTNNFFSVKKKRIGISLFNFINNYSQLITNSLMSMEPYSFNSV